MLWLYGLYGVGTVKGAEEMTYHKEEYTLHNGQKIYAEYNEYNVCKVTKECMEMLLDLHWQGKTEAKEDTNLKDTIKDIHDNVAHEMYCKGIDDMCTEISSYFTYGYCGNLIDVFEIAERLKEHK